jgi:hypothetical protein
VRARVPGRAETRAAAGMTKFLKPRPGNPECAAAGRGLAARADL